jgi:hypothetical protein
MEATAFFKLLTAGCQAMQRNVFIVKESTSASVIGGMAILTHSWS